MTNFDGEFSVEVPDGKNTLVISYIGYKDKEVDITGKSEIEVQLEPNIGQLDAVIVVGSRGKPRTSFDSPVAVDNFDTKSMQKTGKPTIDKQLTLKVPLIMPQNNLFLMQQHILVLLI